MSLRHAAPLLRQAQLGQASVALRAACSLMQLHNTAASLEIAPAQQPTAARRPPPPPPPPPLAARPLPPSSSSSLVVQQQQGLLQRTIATALDTINRMLMLFGSLGSERLRANEAYVQRYLERLGMDSFTIEHVTRPALFRLAVARDIEPVVSWLRSLGIQGGELVELVRHTPAVLSASVDEQLEPLSALIRGAGGSPRDVLLTYPGLVAVPVAHLAGARHVLRQLGCVDQDVSLMLVSLPHLYAQLADALHRLFQDFGVAAWKLQVWQRRQLRGVIHHHMRDWNRPVAAAPTAGHFQAGGEARDGGAAPPAAGSQALMDSDDESGSMRPAPGHRHSHLRGGGTRPCGGAAQLATSYLLAHEAPRRLQRVQAALEALALQEEAPEDFEAAAGELAHSVQLLEDLAAEAERKTGQRHAV